MTDSGRSAGVAIHDLTAQGTTAVSTDNAFAVKWLADSHRIVYFAGTHRARRLRHGDPQADLVDVRLPGPAIMNEMIGFSRRQPDDLLRRGAGGGGYLNRGARQPARR